MRRLALLILALSLPLMGHAQSSSQAAALRTQIASESAALEAQVAADPSYARHYNDILASKKKLKQALAGTDPVEVFVWRSEIRVSSDVLESHVASDPKYKDAYAHIDLLVKQTDGTLRHHYVTNKEPQ